MRFILALTFIVASFEAAIGQISNASANKNQVESYSYAYITIEGKGFGKKLKVEVDLGDTDEQVAAGKEFSEILTNKKSFAAVLNYMSEKQYELVESRDYSMSIQGTGGTYGVVFIMRKKITIQ